MWKNKYFWLVIFSLLALVGFFVLVSAINILSQTGEGERAEEEPLGDNQAALESKISGPDPLITPGEPYYDKIIRETDPTWGKQGASLRIIEFGDFQCPYCLNMQQTLTSVLPGYKDKVVLVWKDFPNPIHTEAKTAAMAARCAQKQDKFWEYHDYLFENQDNLSREVYNKIALELNLDLAVFNKCLDGKETAELVGEGLLDGQQIGADATPYVIIGTGVYNYALSEEELKSIIDSRVK